MRHGKKVNHLGRNSSHRKAMLSNMATSLIMHKRIRTTVAKAKALRKYVEPLISKSKEDSTHSRRVVFSYLQEKNAVTELFREISQKVGDRPGGYTRILRTGYRIGDAAEMCIIELVDYNENYTQNKAGKQSKSKATRRSKAKKQIGDILSANEDNTAMEDIQLLEEISTTENISNTEEVSEQIQDTADAEDKTE
ncbi:MAG: 50S ribosomal protein L17 [Bacteroidales bacterium]|jgi:large subunit ribosomal protein L17|nr:50S ribosomal protein L17 [Bacteroidales bacterium]